MFDTHENWYVYHCSKNICYVVSSKIMFIIFWHKATFLLRYCRGICDDLNPTPCLEHNLITEPNINLLPRLSETRKIVFSRYFRMPLGEVGQVRPCPGETVPHMPAEPVSQPCRAASHRTLARGSRAPLMANPAPEWPDTTSGGRAKKGTGVFKGKHEVSSCFILPCPWSFCLNMLGTQELVGS